MKQPDTGILCLESQHGVAVTVYGDGVALHRDAWELASIAIESSRIGCWSGNYLKLVAVEVKRMDGYVEIIDRDLNDVASFNYKWIDIPVDYGIRVVKASANCCE